MVGTRTKLVNHVRATVKSLGHRLPACSAQGFPRKVAEHLPEPLRPALEPVLETISSLTAQIREYDRKLETVAEELYPQTGLLRQVKGVGPLTALAFVLTIEDPWRFADSRTVAPISGWYRARTNPVAATRSSTSPSAATRCSESCWSVAPTTCSARSAKTPISGATA